MKKIVFLLAALVAGVGVSGQIRALSGRLLRTDEVDRYVRRQMDSLQLPGLSIAIINDGRIVYHRALGVVNTATRVPVNDSTLFEAASLSKPVFADYVLELADKGLFHPDTPLYKYLPYEDIASDERYRLITARMVLAHTTGFPNWRWFDKPDSTQHVQRGQLYLKFTPGAQFSYSGEGFFYLSKVIAHLQHSTIQHLDSLFQLHYTRPHRLKYAWYSWHDGIKKQKATGYKNGQVLSKNWPVAFPEQDATWFGAAGGLHTEANTFATFLIHLLQSGKEAMFKEQVRLPADAVMRTETGDTAWGLGIGIKPVPFGTLYEHGGNNGNFQSGFAINRANQTGYVFFTNCDKGAAFNKRLQAFLLQ
ncbi:serine hydrolase domain-containing protein [Chitinophaga lutea]